ncbi:MAG TPA: hypothetical protein VM115_13650 [Vicinamibacterales bacterium]|nr:hypothetical protein [Vicinamibacterales bacterium]
MKNTIAAVVVTLLCSSPFAFAQAGQKPSGQKPAPSTRKPATAKPVPAKPATTAKPTPPPPPTDIRFTSRYTTGDQITEGTTYLRGARERYELGDMILLRQHDLKQTVQISRSANAYLIAPDTAADASAPAADAAKPSGVVTLETSIADVGERKPLFGQEARHVMTVIDRQPQPGACDQSKQRMETDGWYIDAPKALAAQPPTPPRTSAAACRDEIKATVTGEATLLGFPVAYTTTAPGPDGKPVIVMQMEVTAYEVTKLDASLFDIPPGMTAVTNGRELAKAISDANETKLAARAPTSAAAPAKKTGTIRVGVPELANKTTQNVDTRALRTQLIAELAEQKMEGVPLAAAPQDELHAYAKEIGCDYVLVAQITELKASKPGRIGRMIKATAGEAPKDVTEAKLTVQLVPVGAAKPRYSTNTSGNDGGIGLKTSLRLARFAAMMYLKYASPLGALNTMSMLNMGGMGGFLNNPLLAQLQGGGAMGGMGGGFGGVDRTAGAAMYIMDAAMAGAGGDGSQDGPSFDASLAEALQEGAKKVGENLKR